MVKNGDGSKILSEIQYPGRELVPRGLLREGQKQALRKACEERENRGLALFGEAPDRVRGLARIQYPPRRVIEKECGGWLETFAGAGKTIEVKHTRKEEQKQTFRVGGAYLWDRG